MDYAGLAKTGLPIVHDPSTITNGFTAINVPKSLSPFIAPSPTNLPTFAARDPAAAADTPSRPIAPGNALPTTVSYRGPNTHPVDAILSDPNMFAFDANVLYIAETRSTSELVDLMNAGRMRPIINVRALAARIVTALKAQVKANPAGGDYKQLRAAFDAVRKSNGVIRKCTLTWESRARGTVTKRAKGANYMSEIARKGVATRRAKAWNRATIIETARTKRPGEVAATEVVDLEARETHGEPDALERDF